MKITKPLSREAIKPLLDEDNYFSVEVEVELNEIIDAMDMDSFNDLMEDKIVERGVLGDIGYSVVGHRNEGESGGSIINGIVVIQVTAEYNDIDCSSED